MIGGGFGKLTPPEIIHPIADRSKELNLKIGKIEVTAEQVKEEHRSQWGLGRLSNRSRGRSLGYPEQRLIAA